MVNLASSNNDPTGEQTYIKARKLPAPLPEKATQPLERPIDLDVKRLSFKSPKTQGNTFLSRKNTGVPLPRPEPLVPIQSEPTPTSRRSIFGDFWGSSSSASSSSLRQRSSPCLAIAEKSEEENLLTHRPSMSRSSSSSFSSDDFQQLPERLQLQLPPLPSPLQRMKKHSGVYPLMQPKSILRNGNALAPASAPKTITGSFNLTRTLHDLPLTKSSSLAAEEESDSTTASSTDIDDENDDITTSDHHPKVVRFDPRVTVTELYSEEPRVWYADSDLERFKNETVSIAKQYLTKHPEKIPAYSKPTLDPVTNTYRKKALFSMPALSSVSESSSDESEGLTQDECDRNVVQQILVVDRNDCILSLFRRSLSIIFPQGNIQCVNTAQAALRLCKNQSFDIVISEERLNRRLLSSCHEFEKLKMPQSLSVPADIQSGCMSGSELFQELQDNGALLIGIVICDEDSFADCADITWGKPPPRMDGALKQQLIDAVKAKRKNKR